MAHYGYIMETGKVVIDGSAERLASDPDAREFYLGVGGGGEGARLSPAQALQAPQALAVATRASIHPPPKARHGAIGRP